MPGSKHIDAENISHEVSEIIGQVPSWIVRRGIATFFLLLLVLIAGSWFFRYPDVVVSRVTITTGNPPSPAVARTEGKIALLFVSDTQPVFAGDLLAVIENPAHTDHVMQMQQFIMAYGPAGYSRDTAGTILNWQGWRLGEVQDAFARHQKAYMEYRHFIELDFHRRKIGSLEKELEHYRNHYRQVLRQCRILEREHELFRKQFVRDSSLHQDRLIADAAYEQSEATLLRKAHELEQARINLSGISVLIAGKEREILELEMERELRYNSLYTGCIESFEVLRAAAAQWEQRYVLRAPADGTVSFTRFWSRDQYVNQGETVMTIIPAGQGDLIGRINLPQRRTGKIFPGQRVLIRLDNYPYLEFGLIEGAVNKLSKVTDKDEFVAEISLPRSLLTSYGLELEFVQGMQGTAEIITDERPLLMRILEPFRYLYERHFGKTNDQNGRSSSAGGSSSGISSGKSGGGGGGSPAFSILKAERLVK